MSLTHYKSHVHIRKSSITMSSTHRSHISTGQMMNLKSISTSDLARTSRWRIHLPNQPFQLGTAQAFQIRQIPKLALMSCYSNTTIAAYGASKHSDIQKRTSDSDWILPSNICTDTTVPFPLHKHPGSRCHQPQFGLVALFCSASPTPVIHFHTVELSFINVVKFISSLLSILQLFPIRLKINPKLIFILHGITSHSDFSRLA